MITRLGVIIPAHNEEEDILGCLESVQRSRSFAVERGIDCRFRVLVVADACTDATEGIVEDFAARHHDVFVLATSFQSVGRARDFGWRHFMRTEKSTTEQDSDSAWIAFTDADSRVPEHWITTHLELAATGVDCLVGTVAPRPETASTELIAAWHANHELLENHPYIFGANMGLRAGVLEAMGGVPPLVCGEDEAIVDAVLREGGDIRRTDDCRVLTSARLSGRTCGGFSSYLRQLS
ncbi:glycosyltransferase [Brevibacterium sp. JSBI002]|uniref:glycosyltransferase n=1 Tax=Brevibacterium sp. JSBI002 TaxID=2886045 RepID=UPI0022317872|nr:glycosyltransferase [Brevibacterium sp. JSBI002]UZD62701.1 glycosyltransferase [Brevibacterium sp. JSBI002]